MRSKDQTSCFSGWIHYLLIASTTKLLITFTYQSSGHKRVTMLGASPTQDKDMGPDLETLPAGQGRTDGWRQ